MLFDSLMVTRIVADLRRLTLGARVDRVFSPAPNELTLDLARRLPRPQIALSWNADSARVHLTADQEPRPDLHPAFTDVLRRHLRGATLVSVDRLAFDRVLWLDFANAGGLGPGSRVRLLVEIMARRSNAILLDPGSEVIACAHNVSSAVNRMRETLPGSPYTPPPLFDRLDPAQLAAQTLLDLASASPELAPRELIARRLQGASEAFMVALEQRCDLASPREASLWVPETLDALHALLDLAANPGPGYYHPAGSCPAVGRTAFAYPCPLTSGPTPSTTEDLSVALERVVRGAAQAGALNSRRGVILAAAERGLRKAAGRVAERERALEEAAGADQLRRRGELILANLHQIPNGASEAAVVDYYDPNQATVQIALDPRRAAQDQAAALFARYKKAQRTLDRVPALLELARAEREYFADILEQAAAADGLDELEGLAAELVRQELLKPAANKRGGPRREPRGPRRLSLPGGHALIYGRSGSENDAVLREASPDDLWFHVRSGPGGHVVLRASGDREPSDEVLRMAASLAAGLSRWRVDARAEVSFTRVRHVRKPPGAPPGFVTYTDFRTIQVAPCDPGQLAAT